MTAVASGPTRWLGASGPVSASRAWNASAASIMAKAVAKWRQNRRTAGPRSGLRACRAQANSVTTVLIGDVSQFHAGGATGPAAWTTNQTALNAADAAPTDSSGCARSQPAARAAPAPPTVTSPPASLRRSQFRGPPVRRVRAGPEVSRRQVSPVP